MLGPGFDHLLLVDLVKSIADVGFGWKGSEVRSHSLEHTGHVLDRILRAVEAPDPTPVGPAELEVVHADDDELMPGVLSALWREDQLQTPVRRTDPDPRQLIIGQPGECDVGQRLTRTGEPDTGLVLSAGRLGARGEVGSDDP